MDRITLRINIGLAVALVTALWWLAFGIGEYFLKAGYTAGLIEGGLLSGLIFLLGFIAYRFRVAGGWLLVFAGVFPAAFYLANGSFNWPVLLLLSLPLIVSGILFVLE
jgi:hypothetical protein